jgi:hypothetical protein
MLIIMESLLFQYNIACIAPTGIAASNLPGGSTIPNFCGITVSLPL